MRQAAEHVAAPDDIPVAFSAGRPGLMRRMVATVWTGLLFRWAAFFGFIVSASNCPFCGRTGCPQGLATAGVAAGILAAFSKRRHRHGSGRELQEDALSGGRSPE